MTNFTVVSRVLLHWNVCTRTCAHTTWIARQNKHKIGGRRRSISRNIQPSPWLPVVRLTNDDNTEHVYYIVFVMRIAFWSVFCWCSLHFPPNRMPWKRSEFQQYAITNWLSVMQCELSCIYSERCCVTFRMRSCDLISNNEVILYPFICMLRCIILINRSAWSIHTCMCEWDRSLRM